MWSFTVPPEAAAGSFGQAQQRSPECGSTWLPRTQGACGRAGERQAGKTPYTVFAASVARKGRFEGGGRGQREGGRGGRSHQS